MNNSIDRKAAIRRSMSRGRAGVIPFRSAADHETDAALASFITKARQENPLRVANWEAQYWPFPHKSRASSSGDGGLHFSVHPATKGTLPEPFPEPFQSFVKAIVCRHEQRATKGFSASQCQILIAAARRLFAQFGNREPSPVNLTWGDFEAAAQDAKASMGEGAVNIGSKLAFIARCLDDLSISKAIIAWRNPLKRLPKHDAIGPVADRRRSEFLPSDAVLNALADISHRADLEPRDLIVQRAIDLIVCLGFRVNECLTLPRNCLVEELQLDDVGQPLMDPFGKPLKRLGLRYWPEKGFDETLIKWVPTALADVVRRAVNDILRFSEAFASTAKYQCENPGCTILGSPWDALDPGETLSPAELEDAVGLAKGGSSQFIRVNKLPYTTKRPQSRGRDGWHVDISDLRECLYARSQKGNVLRHGEGIQDLADCLFLLPLRYLHRGLREGVRGTVAQLKDAQINAYLVGLRTQPSVFERLGYLDGEGKPLRATPHQFRHWLTTLALQEGLNQVEVARWMGRKQTEHNDSYDHRTPVERARRVAERLKTGEIVGPVADAVQSIRDPVRRAEFIMSNCSTAHLTDLGVCVHPWDALPCQEHGACSTCPELRIEKGNQRNCEAAKDILRLTEMQIEIAKSEDADGTFGADRWLAAHMRASESLARIIEVHEDPAIPDGWLVQISSAPDSTDGTAGVEG